MGGVAIGIDGARPSAASSRYLLMSLRRTPAGGRAASTSFYTAVRGGQISGAGVNTDVRKILH